MARKIRETGDGPKLEWFRVVTFSWQRRHQGRTDICQYLSETETLHLTHLESSFDPIERCIPPYFIRFHRSLRQVRFGHGPKSEVVGFNCIFRRVLKSSGNRESESRDPTPLFDSLGGRMKRASGLGIREYAAENWNGNENLFVFKWCRDGLFCRRGLLASMLSYVRLADHWVGYLIWKIAGEGETKEIFGWWENYQKRGDPEDGWRQTL